MKAPKCGPSGLDIFLQAAAFVCGSLIAIPFMIVYIMGAIMMAAIKNWPK